MTTNMLTIHGCLLTLIGVFFAWYIGSMIDIREGNERMWFGWTLAAVSLAAGVTWQLGI